MKTLLSMITLLSASTALASTPPSDLKAHELLQEIRAEKAAAATRIETLLRHAMHPHGVSWESHAVAYTEVKDSMNRIAGYLRKLESNHDVLSEAEKAAVARIGATVVPVSQGLAKLIIEINEDRRAVLTQPYLMRLKDLAAKSSESAVSVRDHVMMALNRAASPGSGL